MKKVILFLKEVKEMGFRQEERGRRGRENDVLLLLRKGVQNSHAQETRPLDGVPEKVNVMHRVC